MRVLIADDHSLFRDGLLSLLKAAGMKVVGEAADGESAVRETLRLSPDLVLLDIDMPRLNGMEALIQIKAQRPEVKVVMLTASSKREDLLAAIEAGANGYLLKNLDSREFVARLRAVERGEAALSGEMAAHLMSHYADRGKKAAAEAPTTVRAVLSEREVAVLRLVARGLNNKQIAAELDISENTVKFHVKNILQKLNLKNRAEAAAYAAHTGVVSADPT